MSFRDNLMEVLEIEKPSTLIDLKTSQADGWKAEECKLTNLTSGDHDECPYGWLYDRHALQTIMMITILFLT